MEGWPRSRKCSWKTCNEERERGNQWKHLLLLLEIAERLNSWGFRRSASLFLFQLHFCHTVWRRSARRGGRHPAREECTGSAGTTISWKSVGDLQIQTGFPNPVRFWCHKAFCHLVLARDVSSLGCCGAIWHPYAKAQGLGQVLRSPHGDDVVQYLEWDQDLGKLTVLHSLRTSFLVLGTFWSLHGMKIKISPGRNSWIYNFQK